jgi:L-threonylcarbamoyladenylate synthase
MTVRLLKFRKSSVTEAARSVKAGGLIVFPTDTVYGLGCDPKNEAAVERLFAAKRREPKPIPILCDSLESAVRCGSLSETALELALDFWPGALTIVAPMRESLPRAIHQGTGEVGLRVPDSRLCMELISQCGGTITGTSANVSGRPSCRRAEEAARELGKSVDLILDGGSLEGRESTVVRVRGSVIEVLRKGTVRVGEKRGKA